MHTCKHGICTQNNISNNDVVLVFFLSPSPAGWWEVVLRAPCPASAALPAPNGVSPPPELSSQTPPATHASYHASVTCTLWSAWRPRPYFDVTSLTWRWSRKSSSLLSWYDCDYVRANLSRWVDQMCVERKECWICVFGLHSCSIYIRYMTYFLCNHV